MYSNNDLELCAAVWSYVQAYENGCAITHDAVGLGGARIAYLGIKFNHKHLKMKFNKANVEGLLSAGQNSATRVAEGEGQTGF